MTHPDAVPAEGPDAGVAAHYGQPLPEARALEAGRAVVDLSHLHVLSVSGDDRLAWLHTLTSQHVADLAPGTSTEILFLSAQGRIEHAAQLLEDGTTAWLIVEPKDDQASGVESLVAWLTQMRFAHHVTLRRHHPAVAVVGATAPVPGWEDRTVWVDPWPHVSPGGAAYSGPDHPGEDYSWRQYLVTAADRDALFAGLGSGELQGWRAAGTRASEALRIAAGRPRVALDADERTIPHELDLLRTAVHLEKGCYRGQETVARVHNLGRPPRRLTGLLLDGSGHSFPERGAAVIVRPEPDTEQTRAAARPIGVLTSIGQHPEAGHVGLALLKRSVPVDAELLVAEPRSAEAPSAEAAGARAETPRAWIAASQEVLVSPEAGAHVGRGGITRLR
ncbi:MAG: folate-binding protein [Micrococcus sp.]|nr:folate-binding protein [Micrococcus sp.]